VTTYQIDSYLEKVVENKTDLQQTHVEILEILKTAGMATVKKGSHFQF